MGKRIHTLPQRDQNQYRAERVRIPVRYRALTVFLAFCLADPCAARSGAAHAGNKDSSWSVVLAGQNVTQPVRYDSLIYTFSADRALNCVNSKGSFVWRRNCPVVGTPFLSVSDDGLVYVSEVSGRVWVFSSQGIPVREFAVLPAATRGAKRAVNAANGGLCTAPVILRDGRLLYTTAHALLCFSSTGQRLWSQKLGAKPLLPPTDAKTREFFITGPQGTVEYWSIFGEKKGALRASGSVRALTSTPRGYVVATDQGLWRVRTDTLNSTPDKTQAGKTAKQHQAPVPVRISTQRSCVALFATENMLIALFADGAVRAYDADGENELFSLTLPCTFSSAAQCRVQGDEIVLSDTARAITLSAGGALKWNISLYETPFTPLITTDGLVVSAGGWVLNAYRAETRLIDHTPIYNRDSYFHVLGSSRRAHVQEAPPSRPAAPAKRSPYDSIFSSDPFFSSPAPAKNSGKTDNAQETHTTSPPGPYATPELLLQAVQTSLKEGNVGPREPAYARSLHALLTSPHHARARAPAVTSARRAQAATLLGALGAHEYRDALLELLKEQDYTVLEGILKGLTRCTFGLDERALLALYRVTRAKDARAESLMRAACDALAACARSAPRTLSEKAVSELSRISTGAFPYTIRAYARTLVQSMLR
nr:PQQ-binding-like beta-propeller repeat protein [Treponema pallidum]